MKKRKDKKTKINTLCMAYWCSDNCHQQKEQGVGFGHLPARNAQAIPRDEVTVDFIGPSNIEVEGKEFTFNAFDMY